LVVDDERVITQTFAAIFETAGYDVEAFCNGATARNETSGPHLAIIDPLLEGLSGVDLAIHLVARFPQCKILLLSARAGVDQSGSLDGRNRGYDFPLLSKPIHPEELLQRVAAELNCPSKNAVAGPR
jgi:DNA-binding response OmpR family regulator